MTPGLKEQCRELEARVAILTAESEALSERAEETLLLRLVGETIGAAGDQPAILAQVLEKLSVLKDIPYCACCAVGTGAAHPIVVHRAFATGDEITGAIPLAPAVGDALRDGPHVVADLVPGDSRVGLTGGGTFVPKTVALVPFESREVPEGVFLFADDDPAGDRLSPLMPLLQQVVDMTTAKLDERSLIVELQHLNAQLEERVRERTAELRCVNENLRAEIRKRERTQDALREGEERYRILVERMEQGVVYQDATGAITAANPAATRILGLTPDELRGRSSGDRRWHAIRPDGSPFPGAEHPSMVSLQTGQPVRGVVMGVYNPTEEAHRWITVDATPLFQPGEDVPFEVYTVFTDITERKRAADALQREKAHFENLFQSSPEAIALVDEQSRVLRINGEFTRLFGYRMEDLAGKSVDDVLPPPEQREAARAITQRVAEGGREVVEAVRRTKDGRLVPVSILGAPIAMEGSVAAYGIYRDLTAQKHAEQQLNKLTKAVETSGEVVFLTDRDGCYTYVNPEFTTLYGYAADEVVGKQTPRVLRSGRYGEDFYREFWETILGGRVAQGELVNRTRDGRLVTVDSSASPVLADDGSIIGFLAIQRDVTERKQTESALLTIAKGVSAATGETFFHELATHLSRALGADYAIVGEVLGERADRVRTLAVCVDGEIVDNLEYDLPGTPCQNVLTAATCVYPSGVQHQFPDDRLLVEMGVEGYVGTPLRDSEGHVLGIVVVLYRHAVPSPHLAGSMLEIFGTRAGAELERVRAEEQRRLLEAELRHAQKMESIGHLAGGVAHDFNNLLVPIFGYTEILLADFSPDDPRYADLVAVREAAERAKDLTRQLLAFGRKQVLEMKTFALAQIVAGFEPILRRTIRENIDIELQLAADAGNIVADVLQVEQVLMNLAVNAQDAMPDGGRLIIEVRNTELDETFAATHPDVEPGAFVMLAVSDTGVGMDASTLKQVFEPFFTTKERGKGTGLGLATVYGIVTQHGGGVWAFSEPGRGTTFSTYFPLAAEDAVVAVREETPPAPVVGGSETVLVVEDEDTVRTLVCGFLRRNGYRIVEANSAEHAIEVAQQGDGPIDLLLTDVVLPRMNGRQLYQRLRRPLPRLRALYMSGYADAIIVQHGVLEDGVALIQKPFSVNALARKIRSVLDK